jgi:nucleotide-binding universal stress UspA family protein
MADPTGGPIRKILVYIDGTEESITACQYAILLAKASGAELCGLYVVNTRALQDLVKARIFLKEEQLEYQRDIEADADRYLNHFRELASQKGMTVEAVKRSGNVHQEVKKLVEDMDIDLLVLGQLSQIRSRRDEFFNEAERAMRGVRCSVLIAKDDDRVWDLFEMLP